MNILSGKRRLLLVAAVLAAGGTSVSLLARPASAQVSICRTDPIFQLSNGYHINVTAQISTSPASVRQISYFVHIPAGATVTHVTFTGGAFSRKESANVVADDSAGTFDTDTVVTTTSPSSVTASTAVQNGAGTTEYRASASASGQSGQHLHVHL